MLTEAIISRMQRVFLKTGTQFSLVWNGTQYELKNHLTPVCHPLEISLIGQRNLTGYKIKDIEKVMKKNKKWILGFHHAIVGKKVKYKYKDYIDGHEEGSYFVTKNEIKLS